MVFAVALLLALVEAGVVGTAGAKDGLERVAADKVKVNEMRVTQDKLTGEGERLGTAYRLTSGEIVYVPDPNAPRKPAPPSAPTANP
jgi:hypothetical protein